jgi:hypothetical protein
MEQYEKYGMTNQFESEIGKHRINFRNTDDERTEVHTIEIKRDDLDRLVVFPVKAEDNVPMALSVLGLGRVTQSVEERAKITAEQQPPLMRRLTDDELIEEAVVRLRAVMIRREREQGAVEQELDDAYALYKLAYPQTNITREEFPGTTLPKFWAGNLRAIRQDPTKLAEMRGKA